MEINKRIPKYKTRQNFNKLTFILKLNLFLKILEILENDVRKLRHDLSIFQTHILKTEVWCDNIGAKIYFLKFEPLLCLIMIML